MSGVGSKRPEQSPERVAYFIWHVVSATAELMDEPTKEVRLLGADVVLYKDSLGNLGLIGRRSD